MYILAIDQGTTGTTALIVDQKTHVVGSSTVNFKQHYPKPGWVEHNPQEIWVSVENAISSVMGKTGIQPSQISCIGITNQRETTVVWDKATGKEVYPAIVWQCRRTEDICEKIKKDKTVFRRIKNKTGLILDAYFSGTKINWILKQDKDLMKRAKAGEVLFGNIDTYLLWRMTGGKQHRTDVSNASRTLLMNLKTLEWDDEMLKIFKVPKGCLPEICPSSFEFGTTSGFAGLPDGIPIAGIAGDQQAALFGQTAFKKGEIKCTFGTGSFILANTGKEIVKSKKGLLTTVGWKIGDETTYALEGGAFVCGAAVQWLRDDLEFIKDSSEIEALANQVSDSGGVYFVPALAGLGAPHWHSGARGMISGLTRGTTKAHIARATLEGMALQNADIMNAMREESGAKIKAIRVDGGASKNNLLMQMQADSMNAKVVRPKQLETTALGSAFLAGLQVGIWKSMDELKDAFELDREFTPEMKNKKRQTWLDEWSLNIKRCSL
jgi:glycerol kinase